MSIKEAQKKMGGPGEKQVVQPMMFDLGYRTKVHLFSSRVDGEPYLRLTRDCPVPHGNKIHLNWENFKYLMKAKSNIDRGMFDPQHSFRPYMNLDGMGCQVTVKDLDSDFDDKVMLQLERTYEDEGFLRCVRVHPVAWRNWQANFMKINNWMKDVRVKKNYEQLQVSLRLTFKTRMECEHFPASAIMVREMQGMPDRKFILPLHVLRGLKDNLCRLDVAITADKEVDIMLSGAYHVATTLFNDRMYVSFAKYDEKGKG